ncbi:glycosyltransferase [Candidatus Dojkabacteria bacterium]|uniref:Glycosyltransferase n=1 Tax=Candidatus Dojkabacteria bacterium TaxID=2099670 RepID=A0A3M0Z055_9BACT|nr:MAG: glycosyltransferase [Candidatus Dojkabacteria bacterium]
MHTKKIIILHDYFLYKGGGERLVITMAKRLGADIATAFISNEAFNPKDYGIKTIELYKESRWSKIPGFRYTQVHLSFLFKTKFIQNYDIIIYSGDCLNALLNAKGKVNIAYMHTPPRHLYDSYQDRLRSYGFFKKLIFIPYAFFNRWRFKKLSQKLDLIITNSQTVQERIKKYLGLDSVIAYPPCNTEKFRFIEQGDYFFSWARLYPAKRVDMIVEAFTKMPDKRLIVASGGPELDKLKKMAQGHKNIEIKGWISDEELFEILGRCLATIYIPIREDFGMSPVESMSAGKPVIGVNEGGLRETIIHDKTGILLDPKFNVNDIINAVHEMTPQKALSMKKYCEERAKDFTEDKFIDKIREYLSLFDY